VQNIRHTKHEVSCSKRQMSGMYDNHLMVSIMQLSFKFQYSTDHTRHLVPMPKGQMYSTTANCSLLT